MIPRVMIIAGSDPSGGAGIQADIKTVTALGGYAMTAITAITVQNTCGVQDVMSVPDRIVHDQIKSVLDDVGCDAIKVGMIGSVDTGKTMLNALAQAGWSCDKNSKTPCTPMIVDPVLAATSGDSLAQEGVREFLKTALLPKTYLVTPNIPEAQMLTNRSIECVDDQIAAAHDLIAMGARCALVKGGHASGDQITDVLVTQGTVHKITNQRLDTTSTHGTGCTLASAITTGLASGMAVQGATQNAIDYVRGAIKAAPGFGKGNGPLDHGYRLRQ